MTKEEIRAIALSKLNLQESIGFLDIGAGTGSVAIEAKLSRKGLPVTAIEYDDEACRLIGANIEKHQIKGLDVIQGRAPLQSIRGTFDRFFIGGSEGALEAILEWIQEIGYGNCEVMVSCLTLETQMAAYTLLSKAPFSDLEGVQINIQKLDVLGSYHYFKPANGITLLKASFKGAHQ